MLKTDPAANRGRRELEEMEDRIEKLKLHYDKFFSGVENIDPSEKKVAIRRLITRLNEMHVRNPVIRFRFQSLVGRFVSLNQHWTRTMRAIEEGTFQRNLFRTPVQKGSTTKAYYGKTAPMLENETDEAKSQLDSVAAVDSTVQEKVRRQDIRVREIDENDIDKLSKQRPLMGPGDSGVSPSTASDSIKPAVSKVATGLDDGQVDKVYQEFIQARKASNDSTDVKKDTLKKQLDQQYKTLRKKYKSATIEFKVKNKDDKVIIKPIVKKT